MTRKWNWLRLICSGKCGDLDDDQRWKIKIAVAFVNCLLFACCKHANVPINR